MVSKVSGDDFRGSQELISTGHLHVTLPSFLTSQASASSPTLHTIYYNQGTRKEGASVLLSLADEGGTWGEGLTRGTDGENGACPLCPSIPPDRPNAREVHREFTNPLCHKALHGAINHALNLPVSLSSGKPPCKQPVALPLSPT